jgi:Fur family ferric uptake transcriptional regulator
MGTTSRVRTERFAAFRSILKKRSLKSTSQRDDIARIFFACNRHISVDELYHEVRKANPRIGYATVYRTVRLLRECGLAAERHFHDGEARFENVEETRRHDHLICERCGRIVEFSSAEIEKLQERVARKLGFVISRYKIELYGTCGSCRTDRQPHRVTQRRAPVLRA